MLESRTTDELWRIASAGGDFSLNARARTTDDLWRIASGAAKKGSRIIFEGLDARTTDELVRIASAGEGCVSFE
jgi:hypothetical protein